jgi:DNA polymerase-3 subunit alpha
LFLNLHTHSEYSLWDGLAKIPEIVARAKKLEQPGIAITDHGTMSSFPEFYKAARAQEIVPIIGMEAYISDDVNIRPPQRAKQEDWDKNYPANRTSWHMTMIALNLEGYQTLAKLSSIGWQDDGHFYRSMRIDFNDLDKERASLKNILVTTGCLGGFIPNALEYEKTKRARRYLIKFRDLFPNFYIELMRHPNESSTTQERVNQDLETLARRYSVPILLTNDSHYVNPGDKDVHRALLDSSTRSGSFKNPDFDAFSGTGYHIKSEKSMQELGWSDWVWNQNQRSMKDIWEQVQDFEIPALEKKNFKWHIPTVPRVNVEEDTYSYIYRLCKKNLEKRGLWDQKRYRKRLKYELKVIESANFGEEFLLVRDYVRYANRQHILVGAGRGSMAGVLTAYALGITDVDPIRYELLFERALNPARPSLPDFDIDFQASRRQEIVEYLEGKYGKENVKQVCTFGTMAPKGAIQAVCRIYEVPYNQMVEATKGLPDTSDITGERASGELKDLLEDKDLLQREVPELINLMDTYPDLKELACGIQGTIQNVGTHAAGVVVSDDELRLKDFVPTRLARGKSITVTQYDMAGLKAFGFVKFDILGLNTLDTIAEAIKDIGYNPFLDMKEYEDQDTWDMMNSGLLATIFQMQGFACRQCVSTMGVKSFEDLVAINALSRPGAMKFLSQYHKQRDHPTTTKYVDPRLAPILDKSNGVLLYQEQTMQIGLDIAGFNHYIIDDLKEAIKYKKSKVFDMLHPKFIEGCIKNGCTEEVAKQLWEMIGDAKGYQFNRAHAVSYAMVGFQSAYLKCHYPAQWFAAYLRTTDTKSPEAKGRVEEILYEARRMGVTFKLPHINKSGVSYRVTGKNVIRLGFTSVKGVGNAAAAELVLRRPQRTGFVDLGDLQSRVERRKVGKRAIDALSGVGALEPIGVQGNPDPTNRQIEYIGFPLEIHSKKRSKEKIDKLFDKYGSRFTGSLEHDTPVKGGGRITRVEVRHTKQKPDGNGGKPYARIKVDWPPYSVELVAWSDTLEQYGHDIKRGNIVRYIGVRQAKWNTTSLKRLEVLEVAKGGDSGTLARVQEAEE